MRGPILKKEEHEAAVIFIDNTDFSIEGEDYQDKMQTILEKYTKLFQVTGGAVQLQKTNYFYS